MRGEHEGFESVHAAILGTAAILFTQTGIHGTSLNDIASAAKLSKGTLYYYYSTKDALIADIAQIHCNRINDILLNWVQKLGRDTDMESSLGELIDSLMLADAQMRKLHVVLLSESLLDSPMLSEIMRTQQQKWVVMLEVGALKIQSNLARRLRERSALFFTLLSGYMLKDAPAIADRDEIIRIVLN